jgi:16S rRNA processing protein RimM
MSVAPDELLLIGRITNAFGLRGQVKMRSLTDRPDHIEQHAEQVYLSTAPALAAPRRPPAPHYTPYALTAIAEHKPGILLLTLEGVHTREQAEALRGAEVFIHQQDAAPLDEGEYYLHQLPGLRVETESGEEIGYVHEVLETGANEVLIVARPDQTEILLPVIRDVVQELDIARGRVVVRLLEGLA